jgi:hypothetical protein
MVQHDHVGIMLTPEQARLEPASSRGEMGEAGDRPFAVG